jgi:hypothetical protein
VVNSGIQATAARSIRDRVTEALDAFGHFEGWQLQAFADYLGHSTVAAPIVPPSRESAQTTVSPETRGTV